MSALARTATSALLILLTAWAVAIVVVPRVAASAGELLHPTPDGSTFWTDTAEAIRTDRPKRGSDALRQLEQQVISRAIGRELRPGEAASANLNRAALGQEISEVLGAQRLRRRPTPRCTRPTTGSVERDGLRRLSRRRSRCRTGRAHSPAPTSPRISTSPLAAERQRQTLIRKINEDMMVNGAGQGYDYLASAEFWRTVPDFVYRAPPAKFAIRSALDDLLALLAWSGLAIGAAWCAARRQPAI